MGARALAMLLAPVAGLIPGLTMRALPVSPVQSGPICTPRAHTMAGIGQRHHGVRMMAILDAFRSKASESPGDSAFFSEETNTQRVKAYRERVERINGLEDDIEALDDDVLAAKTG